MKNIGIIGCGWLGERIAKCLQETYKIFATTTSKQKQLEAMGYYVTPIAFSDVLEIIKIMINKNLHSKTYNIVAPHHPTKREILNRQKNEHLEISEASGRIISSELMTKELSYRFIMPNPLDFDFQ
ncbi:hypothetical protein [Bergeyella zoohelcum]|uniref:Pyrroline-5-carboxylate reductase catalytic N-terminal domain-containing protein n=1 Tax=Bergeyella zoohelcum TaxID=1015 RepID=A0A376BZG5_9FLAO|nr:hypothetical protein [Bergeyella zoohelcum]EKB61044.1 hypothetical protein HMPREF9700_00539 [Bergeyella zoohelcum CCUG 30536]SSZ46864.1 Uncharacterised protein [Bergeyella zoohelcum]